MKAPRMNFKRLALAATALVALAGSAANAANGAWTALVSDKTTGIFVSAISSTVSLSTPMLPLNFPGSRVVCSLGSVSGTGMLWTPWATVGAPIGTSISTISGISASTVGPVTVTNSLTTVTSLNSYHDVGMTVSNTAGQLWVGRCVEIRQ